MGAVIGPISREEWLVLRDIQEVIKIQSKYPDPFNLLAEGIRKEKAIYNEVLGRYKIL